VRYSSKYVTSSNGKITLKKIVLFFLSTLTLLAYDAQYELGKESYKSGCISCHGENGDAKTDMNLIIKPRKLNRTILTQEQSFKIIRNGAFKYGAHSAIMPAFKYLFFDKEIEALSLYIYQTFNKDLEKRVSTLLNSSQQLTKIEENNMLKVGQRIFQTRCALCHGKAGKGDGKFVELSRKNRDFIYPYNLTKTLLTEEQIFLYAKYGGNFWGTDKHDMPSWKNRYTDVELKSVANYVQEVIKTESK